MTCLKSPLHSSSSPVKALSRFDLGALQFLGRSATQQNAQPIGWALYSKLDA
jgi:hypothetical protein